MCIFVYLWMCVSAFVSPAEARSWVQGIIMELFGDKSLLAPVLCSAYSTMIRDSKDLGLCPKAVSHCCYRAVCERHTTSWPQCGMGAGERGEKRTEWSLLGLTWLFLTIPEGVTGRLSSGLHTSFPLWMVRRRQEHLFEAPKGNLLHALDVLNDSSHHCICSNFSFLSHKIIELFIFVHLEKRGQDYQVDYAHANIGYLGCRIHRIPQSLITTAWHPYSIYFRICC